ncbi:7-methylguanosine phosphate-specific 5'-nucleotidase A isoform X3 [Aplysia californica]|uniref:5'-nucleotidase n=1 Tax=Aplysia californica TaxID=6500 RepID=A0ABM0ZV50_APLCA|nr:7-methylguanosine phosphate-specific 5'-nucleotidase A isoform X3 [Aplysia californica]
MCTVSVVLLLAYIVISGHFQLVSNLQPKGREDCCFPDNIYSCFTSMSPITTAAPPSLVKLVPELGQSNVRMKDPAFVETAIRTMMRDAHHKLQVVADFDRTLSKYCENGRICSTTHSVLEESKFMPDFYKEEAKKLKDTYMPIEFDPTKTVAEKIPKMIEWWTKGHKVLEACQLTRDTLQHIVADSHARLRNGCQWFFDKLHQLEIPILIFSAGIGDVIHETITQQSSFHSENMKIVANFLQFDEMGKMTGFAGDEIIHTFNKNENAIHSSDYFFNIKHRENLLLMGDSLGDLKMAEGADHVECFLKIGFLNFKVEENLPQYSQSFDIVILEDESLDVVNGMMRAILDLSS